MKTNEANYTTIIYRTNDYNGFKRLLGNREVNPKRVKQIKKSIEDIGYITNPIVVNERMEVIDGQGRLQALKELGKPVEYIVIKGIGIKECLYMNINQEKWSILDYVKSYAEMGNPNYKKLLEIMELYPIYKLNIIGSAIKGLNMISTAILKRGDFEISQEEYEQGIIKLNFLNRYIPYFKKLPGKLSNFGQAIIYIIQMDGIDTDRLFDVISYNPRELTPWSDLGTCIQSIEELYNKNLGGKNRVYMFTEYKKSLLSNPRRKGGGTMGKTTRKEIYLNTIFKKIKGEDKDGRQG